MNIEEIESNILKCKKCIRLCNINPYPMPHIYYTKNLIDLKIMCIARNPGLENKIPIMPENEFIQYYKDKWYECKIGLYFRDLFGDKIIKNNIFFTNICKCSSPNNLPLIELEKINCLEYLQEQINTINPEYIFTFGNDAKEQIKKILLRENIKVYNFYHPSYFSYKNDNILKENQKQKIKDLINEEFI